MSYGSHPQLEPAVARKRMGSSSGTLEADQDLPVEQECEALEVNRQHCLSLLSLSDDFNISFVLKESSPLATRPNPRLQIGNRQRSTYVEKCHHKAFG